MTAILFNNFSYSYPNGTEALKNISIEIPQGTFTAITGPNGAGKTTFCQAAAGIVPHYYGGTVLGKVVVNGINTIDSSMSELAGQVGTMLEDYESQLVALTVEEEVAFCLENMGLDRDEITGRVEESLAMTGLADYKCHDVAHLSGGQKQRLVIAALLAINPSILVLDEPSSALDPKGTIELYNLLGRLNKSYRITVVVVEHELDRVLPYAGQLIVMNRGAVAKKGTCAEVLRYMWNDAILRKAVPELWTIKFTFEDQTAYKFNNWHTADEAIKELEQYLQTHERACRSA